MSLSTEHLWSWCHNCNVLHYAGGDHAGQCAAGGTHSRLNSGHYALWAEDGPLDAAPADRPGLQGGFLRCEVCQQAFHKPSATGVCVSGGPHTARPSDGAFRWLWVPREGGASSLSLEASQSPQTGWRWCRRCNGLWHKPSGPGACANGGGHTDEGSGLYALVQGPLVPRTIRSVLSALDVEGRPFVNADATGALETVSRSAMPHPFNLEPSGDGRVLLRCTANNLYVVVDAASHALVARAGRDQATPFALDVAEGRRFHLRADVGPVSVTAVLGDPLTARPEPPNTRLPHTARSFDAHAIEIPSLR